MLTETTLSALQEELIRLRRENRRLHAENERLHTENERLHAALQKEVATPGLGFYGGHHEMTAGTCQAPRRRSR